MHAISGNATLCGRDSSKSKYTITLKIYLMAGTILGANIVPIDGMNMSAYAAGQWFTQANTTSPLDPLRPSTFKWWSGSLASDSTENINNTTTLDSIVNSYRPGETYAGMVGKASGVSGITLQIQNPQPDHTIYFKEIGNVAINGGTAGIFVKNLSNGTTNIFLEASVTSFNGAGIDMSTTTGSSNVVVTGNVASKNQHYTAQQIIDYGLPPQANTFRGISSISTGGGSVSVTSDGVVTGEQGIYAQSNGGAVTISGTGSTEATGYNDPATNTAYAGNGVVANQILASSSNAILIDLTGNASAYVRALTGTAISAVNSGTGATTVNAAGTLTGQKGIYAESNGGAVTVSATGSTTATAGNAIAMVQKSGTADITLNGTGSLSATGGNGVDIQNAGTGTVKIDDTGAITTTLDPSLNGSAYAQGVAINVNSTNGGNIEIGKTTALQQALTGPTQAVRLINTGAGNNYFATGAGGVMTATTNSAIASQTVNGNSTLVIGANVTGGSAGISADASGSGNVDISVLQGATVTSTNGSALTSMIKSGTFSLTNSGTVTGSIGVSANGNSGSFDTANTSITNQHNGTLNLSTGQSISGIGTITNQGFINTSVARTAISGNFIFDGGTLKANAGGLNFTNQTTLNSGGGTFDTNWQSATLSGTVKGSGTLTKAGAGSLTLLDTNQASGALSVQQGSLVVGTDTSAIQWAGDIAVANGASVDLRRNADQTYAGILSGAGTLNKYSSQTMTLTGNSSSFTGAFNVQAGTLNVPGQIGGTMTLQDTTLLTGTGTVGSVTAQNGATIQPGNRSLADINGVPQTGTLTMSGNLILNSGSTVQVRADNSQSNLNDNIMVNGTANLGGATLSVLGHTTNSDNSWNIKNRYLIVTAQNGLTGTFGTLSTNFAFMKPQIEYNSTANTATLYFVSDDPPYAVIAQTPNQKAVADALDTGKNSGPSAAGQKMLDKIDSSVTTDTGPAALDALSGAQTTAIPTTALTSNMHLGSAVHEHAFGALGFDDDQCLSYDTFETKKEEEDRCHNRQPIKASPKQAAAGSKGIAAPAPQPIERPWQVWGEALGGLSETFSRNGLPGVTGTDMGGLIGIDRIFQPGLRAGLVIGGTNASFSVDHGATDGHMDAAHLRLYGIAESGPTYIYGSLGYGQYWGKDTRTLSNIGTQETWNGTYTLSGLSADIEVGYRKRYDTYILTPFIGLSASMLRQDAYSETSDNANAVYGLSYDAHTTNSLPGSLGVQIESHLRGSGEWKSAEFFRAAWIHDFNTDRSLTAHFSNLPAGSFTVSGISGDADMARLVAGITSINGKGSTLFSNLTGDFSDSTRIYSLHLGYKYEW